MAMPPPSWLIITSRRLRSPKATPVCIRWPGCIGAACCARAGAARAMVAKARRILRMLCFPRVPVASRARFGGTRPAPGPGLRCPASGPPSVGGPAAVDRQRRAGDGGGRGGAEEGDRGRDLLDGGEALRGLLRQEHPADDLLLWEPMCRSLLCDLAGDERRPDIAWADGIAGHP